MLCVVRANRAARVAAARALSNAPGDFAARSPDRVGTSVMA